MRIVASVLALALFAMPARAEMEQARVALPSPIISFAAEYIAEAMFFKDQGLDVQSQLLAGVASINAVISGSMEFAFSTGSSLTRAAAHGQKLLAIATLSTEPGEFLAMRKDITDAAHFDPKAPLAVRAQLLKGHSFGVGGIGTIGDAFLRVFAKAGGLDPEGFRDLGHAAARYACRDEPQIAGWLRSGAALGAAGCP